MIFRGVYRSLCGARFLRRLGMDSPPFTSRVGSCFHAAALVTLALLWEGGYAHPRWWAPLASAVSVGYLVHDTHLIWTEPSLWEVSALVHHVTFMLLVYFAPSHYPHHTARAYLAELTVFPLNLGWVMFKTGAASRWPRLFAINIGILMGAFLWYRVVAFTLLTFDAISLEAWAMLPMVAGLAVLNWYWYFLLLHRAYVTYVKTRTRSTRSSCGRK